MDNVSVTLQAKSDQLNAADLMGGPATVKILKVTINNGSDQPISVKVDCGYQTYKPCKSMRRLMASLWGLDSGKWVGHSITIYCDMEVTWAGQAVGGIRISHATGIDKQTEITTRSSKTKVITYTVMPLNIIASSSVDRATGEILEEDIGNSPDEVMERVRTGEVPTDAVDPAAPIADDEGFDVKESELYELLSGCTFPGDLPIIEDLWIKAQKSLKGAKLVQFKRKLDDAKCKIKGLK